MSVFIHDSTFATVDILVHICTLDNIADIGTFGIIMAIIKWCGRLWRGQAEDGKVEFHLELPKTESGKCLGKRLGYQMYAGVHEAI